MGKYDINASLTEGCKLSLNELADEIDKEFNLINTTRENILWKFKNRQGSGLIDKLLSLLQFDVEQMAAESDEAKFEMLKLLKELFVIEKIGAPKYLKSQYCEKEYASEEEKRIDTLCRFRLKIIDILAKPRMSNIKTYYSGGGQYGEVLDYLFSDIKSNVYDADERINMIEKIEKEWQHLAQKQFDYVFSDMALADADNAYTELMRINAALESILDNLDFSNRLSLDPDDGVMSTFFNILLTHRQLCYSTDGIRVNEVNDVKVSPDKEYTTIFRKYENRPLMVSAVGYLKEALDSSDRSAEAQDIFDLISYFEEIPEEDHKHYKYAFDKFSTVSAWLMNEKDGTDFSEKFPLALFVTIVQEIIHLKKNGKGVKVRIDYSGYNAAYTTLLSALKKKEDELEPALVHVWIRRIETRFACNYGAYDMIAAKNKAEMNLCRIKEYIYSFRNRTYLKGAHDHLFHLVAVAHISSDVAAAAEHSFRDVLKQKLVQHGLGVRLFAFAEKSDSIYNLFREFLFAYGLDNNVQFSIIANDIASMISESYSPGTTGAKDFTYSLNIDTKGKKLEGSLSFRYDYDGNLFFYGKYDNDPQKK